MTIVYRGRVFSVEVGSSRFPDGSEHEVAVVRHSPSVVLIPMQDPEHVLLIRQFRPALGRTIWEIPAGSLERGETAEAAAARECEEELRLVAGRIERLQSFYPAPGFCDEELIFFRLSDFGPAAPNSPHQPDPDEHIEVQARTIGEARQMVERGEIIDLKTAFGLTLIDGYRADGH